ncbi:MAG: sulfatase-like hydrolase/transferase [Pseudomonadota bacterium]
MARKVVIGILLCLLLLAGILGANEYLLKSDEQFGTLVEAAEKEVMRMPLSEPALQAAAASARVPPSSPRSSSKPNIILVLADDMGWRDVGYNHSEIRTPVMDRLAQTGVRFNRFYAQPTCSPTRAALLTGKAPLRLGILDPLAKNNPRGLPLNEETLADLLKARGYATALVGKWHLGARNLAYHPNSRGFDHFYGNLTGAVGYFDKVHGGGYDWQRNGQTVRDEGYTTQLIAREAEQLIRERIRDKPFFLYAAFGAPHLPNEALASTIDEYANIKDDKRRVHAAMVTELDRAIGRIEATLIDEGIAEETLLWFMSDNGGLTTDNPLRFLPDSVLKLVVETRFDAKADEKFIDFLKSNMRDGAGDNRPFSGGKSTVKEGGVRVPAFAYWPGTLIPHQFNSMATVQDLVPTLLDLVDGALDSSPYDGHSILEALLSETEAKVNPYLVQTVRLGESIAVYRYPYKLIVEDGAALSLFDLGADPLESTNILAQHDDLVAELETFLAAFPRGENIAIPIQDAMQDTDYFGGAEDRKPWAEQAYW